MYREIYSELVKWKNKSDFDRKPLILRGARQVGKSWLMEKLGKDEFEDYIYINFELKNDLISIFDNTINPKDLIEYLSIAFRKKIKPGKTLIIFDEIQMAPRALTSLKYFKEMLPEYHICCAGSLLGIHLSQNRSFPVGKVEFLDVYPMNFKEFLIANGCKDYIDYSIHKNFNAGLDTELQRYLKYYFFIGGMPAAVSKWIETKDFSSVSREIANIADAYISDIEKYSDKNVYFRIIDVWENLATQLSKDNSKYIFGLIKKGARAKDYSIAIQWLKDTAIIDSAYSISKPALPMKAYRELDNFKLYLNDIGLLSYLSGVDTMLILTDNKLFTEYKGALTEQFVFQELRQQFNLGYWASGNYEVDFLISYRNTIIPIEVKAGKTVNTKSLNYYRDKYNPKILVKTSLKEFDINNHVINVPLYYLWGLKDILNSNLTLDEVNKTELEYIKKMGIKL